MAIGADNVNAFALQVGIQDIAGVAGRMIGASVDAALAASGAKDALEAAVQELKSLPPEQYELLQQWLGSVKAGSPIKPPPSGLSREAMEAYLKVAKAYVERGSTAGGMATQITRIRTLQAALGHQ